MKIGSYSLSVGRSWCPESSLGGRGAACCAQLKGTNAAFVCRTMQASPLPVTHLALFRIPLASHLEIETTLFGPTLQSGEGGRIRRDHQPASWRGLVGTLIERFQRLL
jgi:hypothetical protein